MPVKKAPVKKNTVKKIAVKKSPAQKTIAAVSAKQHGMFSWLFVPDMSQGWKGWLVRALLFVVGIFAFTLFSGAGAIMAHAESTTGGVLSNMSYWTVVKMIIGMMETVPFRIALTGLILFVFGLFFFMPRRTLDRTSFVAVSWTGSLWGILAAMVLTAAKEFEWQETLITTPLILITIISVTAVIAGIVCYARRIGVSKLALFLSFPMGMTWFGYSGYFLPENNNKRTIGIKYGWYDKFLGFMLNHQNGQLILAGVILICFAIVPDITNAIMIPLFGALYFAKGKKWLLEHMGAFSWFAAAMNVVVMVMAFDKVYALIRLGVM